MAPAGTTAGDLDSGFGTGGIVTTSRGGNDDKAFDAAGLAETTPFNFDLALVRYNPDGTLDPTFGGSGTVVGGINTKSSTASPSRPAGRS